MRAPSKDRPAAAATAPYPRESGRRRWLPTPTRRLSAWLVLLAWIAVLAGISPLAGKVGDVEDNDATAFLPRGADSTAVAALSERFPAQDAMAAVVILARDGALTDADLAAAETLRGRLAPVAVDGLVAPAVRSDDGRAVIVTVALEREDDLIDAVQQVRALAAADLPAGLDSAVGGPAGKLTDDVEVFSDLDLDLLLVTAGVVTALLLLIYRSPVLWLLPVISVLVATQLANAVIYLLGSHAGLPVDGQSAGLLTVLVFGIGTDYALLLLARYREELRRHSDRFAAMAVAMRRSGPAIVASAATVALGLACLLVAQTNSTRSIGGVGAIGVLAGLVAMLTLLPALLLVAGRWVFWPAIPRALALHGSAAAADDASGRRAGWDRLGSAIARRPRPVWITTVAALGVLGVAALGLGVGTAAGDAYTTTPESVTAQRVIGAHFPAGASAPTQVIAPAGAAEPVRAAVAGIEGVAAITGDVASADGSLRRLEVTLTDPPDSPAAEAAVDRIRAAAAGVDGGSVLVGGPTAERADSAAAAAADRALVFPMVLVVVLTVLILLLRAVVAPVVLVATVVLSYVAAFGAAALALTAIFGLDTVDFSTPLLAFVFLVALGVDYNIFLVHRVRQEVASHGHRDGVLRGLSATGGVITSAGLVLAATFAVFTTLPLVSLLAMGLVVSLGVLIDTFVVRSVLVPALLLDLGPRSWWRPGMMAGWQNCRAPGR